MVCRCDETKHNERKKKHKEKQHNRKPACLSSWICVYLFPSYFQNQFHPALLLLVKPSVFKQNNNKNKNKTSRFAFPALRIQNKH
jgi:hypothetical protein